MLRIGRMKNNPITCLALLTVAMAACAPTSNRTDDMTITIVGLLAAGQPVFGIFSGALLLRAAIGTELNSQADAGLALGAEHRGRGLGPWAIGPVGSGAGCQLTRLI